MSDHNINDPNSTSHEKKIKFHHLETANFPLPTQHGPHEPIIDPNVEINYLKMKKSSLKKSSTDSVDLNLVQVSKLNDQISQTISDDEMELFNSVTDRMIKIISKSQQLLRGSCDVLTFPISTDGIELEVLHRIKTCIIIMSDTIHKISIKHPMKGTLQGRNFLVEAKELNQYGVNIVKEAKTFSKSCNKTHKKWSKRKPKSKFDQDKLIRRNFKSIYDQDGGSENAMLYEDFLPFLHPDANIDHGTIQYYWNPKKLILVTKFDKRVFCYDFHKCGFELQLEFYNILYSKSVNLINCAEKLVQAALKELSNKNLQTGYEALSIRLKNIDQEEQFDPTASIELRASLNILLKQFKELTTTANGILEWLMGLRYITKLFRTFVKQIYVGAKESDWKFKLFPCIKYISWGKMLQSVDLYSSQLNVTFPFLKQTFDEIEEIKLKSTPCYKNLEIFLAEKEAKKTKSRPIYRKLSDERAQKNHP